jgi:sulfite exporter TauE/SafE
MMLPYIAGTRRGMLQSLFAALLFSAFCVVVYMILGGLVAALGKAFLERFYKVKDFLFLATSAFLLLCGAFMLSGREPKQKICALFKGKGECDIILFALLLSISPCAPMLGALAYIGVRAESVWEGVFFGLLFGAGRLLSPFLPAATLGGGAHSLLLKKKAHSLFQKGCGILLIIMAALLLAKTL